MSHEQPPTSFSAFFDRLVSTTPVRNQSQLAEKLNVGRAAISLAKQKDSVPSKWIFSLAREFSLNSDWLATGNGTPYLSSAEPNHNCAHVPHILPRLSGDGSLLFDEQYSQKILFNPLWLCKQGSPDEMVSMLMTGPYMQPEIKENDLVLLHLGDKEMFSGGIFAVGIDGFILIRRTEKSPKYLVLQCDHPGYPDLTLDQDEIDQIAILGKVIWTGREHSL